MGLHVVLVHPMIPQNTGSIGRLCLATQSTLHLIHPLGFEVSHTRLKRAGLDYWQYLQIRQYEHWDAFMEAQGEMHLTFFSKKATSSYFDHTYHPDSFLVFGSETQGLPDHLWHQYASQFVKIPLYDPRVRSLNLAQSVAIAVYEGIRQNPIHIEYPVHLCLK